MRVAPSLPLLAALACLPIGGAVAQDSPPSNPRWSLHWQLTSIWQGHGAFHAEVSGPNSLRDRRETAVSDTATLFFAARPWDGAELILSLEVSAGKGISGVVGVAGFPNGDITRVTSATPKLYAARAFLRQTFDLGGGSEPIGEDPLRAPGTQPARRLAILAGKLAATDVFDVNAFSHDPRTQFLNWSLMVDAAWDYPADTRGYSWGVVVEWATPSVALRAGSFLEPLAANGLPLDTAPGRSHGDVAELELHVLPNAGVVRLLGYDNHAGMGSFREALAAADGGTPDVTATRRPGRTKRGWEVNIEQPLGRDLGAFLRWGADDGHTESWAFTQVDRTVSLGVLARGRAWGRPDDSAGLAFARNGLSADQRAYLAAGGLGFIIGDGSLDYGLERIVEGFYSCSLGGGVSLTADGQRIVNPAMNASRGPVAVAALRLHVER